MAVFEKPYVCKGQYGCDVLCAKDDVLCAKDDV